MVNEPTAANPNEAPLDRTYEESSFKTAAEQARVDVQAARADRDKAKADAEQKWRMSAEKDRSEADQLRAEAKRLREQSQQAAARGQATDSPADPLTAQAESVIKKHSLAALGVGAAAGPVSAFVPVLPAPLLDFAGCGTVQLQMIMQLCRVYGVPFDEQVTKSLVGAVVGSYVPARLGYGGLGMALTTIPLVGPIVSLAVMPSFNYGSTWALGRVFRSHFAAGGNLFNADSVRLGKQYASELTSR